MDFRAGILIPMQITGYENVFLLDQLQNLNRFWTDHEPSNKKNLFRALLSWPFFIRWAYFVGSNTNFIEFIGIK